VLDYSVINYIPYAGPTDTRGSGEWGIPIDYISGQTWLFSISVRLRVNLSLYSV